VSEMTSFRSDSIETIPVKRRMSLLSLILFVTPIVTPLMSALFEHLLCLDKEDTERISRHFRHNASPSILLCSLRLLSLCSAIIIWTQVRTSDPKIHFIPSATSTNTNFRIQKLSILYQPRCISLILSYFHSSAPPLWPYRPPTKAMLEQRLTNAARKDGLDRSSAMTAPVQYQPTLSVT